MELFSVFYEIVNLQRKPRILFFLSRLYSSFYFGKDSVAFFKQIFQIFGDNIADASLLEKFRFHLDIDLILQPIVMRVNHCVTIG